MLPANIEINASSLPVDTVGLTRRCTHDLRSAPTSLEGVCTVSSCMGHLIAKLDGDRYTEGHLWLRLGEKDSLLVEETVVELVRIPTLTYVAKRYFLSDNHTPWEFFEQQYVTTSVVLRSVTYCYPSHVEFKDYVVMVEAPGGDAVTAASIEVSEAAARRASPSEYAINTHHHADHAGGHARLRGRRHSDHHARIAPEMLRGADLQEPAHARIPIASRGCRARR